MLESRATDQSFDDEVKRDWETVFDALSDEDVDDAERTVFIFPHSSQKSHFGYMKAQCGFTNSATTYEGTLGAMLTTKGERPDAEEGIPKLIDLIRDCGVNSLIEQGFIRETNKSRSARAGILSNQGYQYFGDLESGCYHLRTCEHLDGVKDANFVGLGKNPARKGWKPCQFCIEEIEPTQMVIPAVPSRAKPKSASRTKVTFKPGWEKRIEQKAKNSKLTKAQIIQKEIVSICEEYGMYAEFAGGTVFVTTVAGEWFFAYNDRPIRVHHKNYTARTKEAGRSMQHYHLQDKRFASPLHAIHYISEHDIALKRRVMQEVESEIAADEYLSGDAAMDIVSRAFIFVAKAYCEATQIGTNLPYILHSAEAAVIAASVTDDMEVIAAAALHDILEDTEVKAWQIQIEFSARVRKLVEGKSGSKNTELPNAEDWKTQKSETIDYLHSIATEDERIVALADELSNIRACLREYREIGDAMWGKANIPDKKMQTWYYTSLRDALGKLQDMAAWREFDGLINELFPRTKKNAIPKDVETAGGEERVND
jgi:myo-inositol-1(or 4)-monophosphatase